MLVDVNDELWALPCEAVEWVDREDCPPVIKARLLDADGRAWHLVDKLPLFIEELELSTVLPAPVAMACRVIGGHADIVDVEIDRGRPEAEDGTTRFRVRFDQLKRLE